MTIQEMRELLERLYDYFEAYSENPKDGNLYCVCCGAAVNKEHLRDCVVPEVVAVIDAELGT